MPNIQLLPSLPPTTVRIRGNIMEVREIITKIELRNKDNCIPMAQVLSVIVTPDPRASHLGLATRD